MAVTEDGHLLQKINDRDQAAQTLLWDGIRSLALCKFGSALAIGLKGSGTCMITRAPIVARYNEYFFRRIRSEVHSWCDIVQVCASEDAVFALDRNGRVFCAEVGYSYPEVASWQNVIRIVTAPQCNVFGITEDGRILAAGAACDKGPMGDIRQYLKDISNVADVCPQGSECEDLLIAFRDGRLESLHQLIHPVEWLADRYRSVRLSKEVCRRGVPVLDGFSYHATALTEENRLVAVGRDDMRYDGARSLPRPLFDEASDIVSFSVGEWNHTVAITR